MVDGRSRVAWSHTSAVLCLVANVNRDPKKTRPFTPDQFNPHAVPRRKKRGLPMDVEKFADDLMGLAGEPKRKRK